MIDPGIAAEWVAGLLIPGEVYCRKCGVVEEETSPGGLPVRWTDSKEPLCETCSIAEGRPAFEFRDEEDGDDGDEPTGELPW